MKPQETTGRLFIFVVLFVIRASILSFVNSGDNKALRVRTTEMQQEIDKVNKLNKWLIQSVNSQEKRILKLETIVISSWIVE